MAGQTELLSLEVATPEGLVLQTDCESVQAPSVRGEFGVLPGHLPLLAALKSGLLKYRAEGRDRIAAVGPGFVEAEPDKVLLLTEMYSTPDRIDVEAVRKELAEAEGRLAKLGDSAEPLEVQQAQRAVDWALARIEAAEHQER